MELLKAFIRSGENLAACETTVAMTRQQQAEVCRGRELLTIPQMKERGFSESLVIFTVLLLFCCALMFFWMFSDSCWAGWILLA